VIICQRRGNVHPVSATSGPIVWPEERRSAGGQLITASGAAQPVDSKHVRKIIAVLYIGVSEWLVVPGTCRCEAVRCCATLYIHIWASPARVSRTGGDIDCFGSKISRRRLVRLENGIGSII
jgi:hypothetical protein